VQQPEPEDRPGTEQERTPAVRPEDPSAEPVELEEQLHHDHDGHHLAEPLPAVERAAVPSEDRQEHPEVPVEERSPEADQPSEEPEAEPVAAGTAEAGADRSPAELPVASAAVRNPVAVVAGPEDQADMPASGHSAEDHP